MTMLMSNKNVKGCKCCMCGEGTSKGRKANRRHVKRSERQGWMREIRNVS